jgi:glycosyltransferase involved in cell wall biosynthesis
LGDKENLQVPDLKHKRMHQATTSQPMVSIALATFNGEGFVAEQLESLVNQTYPNLEIIVSDDGSEDDTLSILESYAIRYPFITIVLNDGEHGVEKNFENSLKYCNGELIALCDQDDIWHPSKIEILVNTIGDASLIYHNSLLIDQEGCSLRKTAIDKQYSGNNPKVFLLKNIVSGHACLFKKKLLEAALPFPEGLSHDWWLAAVAADECGIKYQPDVLVQYRQHSNNTSDFLGRRLENSRPTVPDIYLEEMTRFHSFQRLKQYPAFFGEWYRLNKNKTSKWFCFRLFYLCIANNKTLFLLYNKSRFSVFFRCLAYLWGMMLKKIVDDKYNFVAEEFVTKNIEKQRTSACLTKKAVPAVLESKVA